MKARQTGSTMVEFSLVLLLFLTFLLTVIDMSRMLFTWNAATEATRHGARYAAICDNTANKADVLARMQQMVPEIVDINLAWAGPASCDATNCEGVTVTITSLNYQWISPIVGATKMAAIPMPTFSTYLPRESMRQDPYSQANCS